MAVAAIAAPAAKRLEKRILTNGLKRMCLLEKLRRGLRSVGKELEAVEADEAIDGNDDEKKDWILSRGSRRFYIRLVSLTPILFSSFGHGIHAFLSLKLSILPGDTRTTWTSLLAKQSLDNSVCRST
jgi:hypothetical protein